MLALKAGYYIVAEDVGSGLGVETSKERSGGDDAHVGVVKALVGTKWIETTNRSAIDQASGNIVELADCE